ncbi:MAG TPA: ABC transporter permease, partial [Pseudogracilibacillus sp.]|nr:ABC transporter permease [Pseudogracilibacillus sp.]
MNKFFVVLSHTYLSRLKAKSFLISTGIILLLITAFANLETIIDFFASDEDEQVIVIDETNELFTLVEEGLQAAEEEVKLVLYEADEATGKEAVQAGDFDGLLTISYDENQLPEAKFYENSAVESWNQSTLQQQLQQIKIALATEQAGVDEATLESIYEPISFAKISLDESAKTDEELDAARGIVYVMLFVLYMAVLFYGQMIATDVATEKSSRVMEILISSASPVTHMFAKIGGIALLGVTQMLIIFLYSVGILRYKETEFTNLILQDYGFTADNLPLYAYALLFFILGYLLYATIAAMLGSLVSRVEDVQQLTMPLVYLVIIAFFIAMFGLVVPE